MSLFSLATASECLWTDGIGQTRVVDHRADAFTKIQDDEVHPWGSQRKTIKGLIVKYFDKTEKVDRYHGITGKKKFHNEMVRHCLRYLHIPAKNKLNLLSQDTNHHVMIWNASCYNVIIYYTLYNLLFILLGYNVIICCHIKTFCILFIPFLCFNFHSSYVFDSHFNFLLKHIVWALLKGAWQ